MREKPATDYDPLFHSHRARARLVKARAYLCPSLHQKSSLGEEGKSSTEEGKDLCPSPEEGKSSTEDGKDLCPSLYQKSSWLGYHGTSITSAIVSVAMNWINRSEKVFGEPGPNDKQHPRAGQQAKDWKGAMRPRSSAGSTPPCNGRRVLHTRRLHMQGSLWRSLPTLFGRSASCGMRVVLMQQLNWARAQLAPKPRIRHRPSQAASRPLGPSAQGRDLRAWRRPALAGGGFEASV